MQRLILMRHAKSDWSFSQPDHDRPLNKRGRKSARTLGDWLRRNDYLPGEALVSTACRTRETFDLLGFDTTVRYDRALYHASAEIMLSVLHEAGQPCVLMLGHNPGICAFAHGMASAAPDHDRFDDFPTGATLVVELPVQNWTAAKPGQGRVLDFIVPRELV